MVKIFMINGKRILFLGLALFIVGFVLLGYHVMLWNLITKGEWPAPEETGIAIGNLLMMIGSFVIKGRNIVRKAVN